jgi:hypothetical protein
MARLSSHGCSWHRFSRTAISDQIQCMWLLNVAETIVSDALKYHSGTTAV